MLTKTFFYLFVFSILSLIVGPNKIMAQVCYPSVRLDGYGCSPYLDKGSCKCTVVGYLGYQRDYQCNTNLQQNPSCRTNERACTSNDNGDACVSNWIDYDLNGIKTLNECNCSAVNCSYSQCWGAGTPEPTPTPEPTAPPCTTTSPTNLSLTQVGFSSWNLTWTKGSGGVKQLVYVDTSKSDVESNCPGSSCFLEDENVNVNSESYSISGLTDGDFYYARVVTYFDALCSSNSSTLTDISSCDLSPTSLTLEVGDTSTLTAGVYSSSEIGSVTFTPSGGFISVDPSSDTAYTYSTEVTGVSVGTGTITSNVVSPLGATYCSDSSGVTVNPKGPWWQVVDGDVQTNGDLNSNIPSGDYFNLAGLGGFPGVAKYGGSTSLSSVNVSEKGWLANSSYTPSNNKVQNYAYFKRFIPSEVTLNQIPSDSIEGSFFESGGVESEGYFWYEYDGGVTGPTLSITSSINLPVGRKVIIFATNADLNIEADISYTSGESLLTVLVSGDIAIDGDVENLQGFFLADGDISTGSSSNAFYFKGSIASQGSLILQRDLGDPLNLTTPAEVFEYDPTGIFLFPPKLSIEKTRWKEVAP